MCASTQNPSKNHSHKIHKTHKKIANDFHIKENDVIVAIQPHIQALQDLGYTLLGYNDQIQALLNVRSIQVLEDIIPNILGKNSPLHEIFNNLKKARPEDKRILGPAINQLQGIIKKTIALKREELQNQALKASLRQEKLDLTLPSNNFPMGKRHPITCVMDDIAGIMATIGFYRTMNPSVDDEDHNFEGLNIPKDHPARQMQDTFYLKSKQVLRSHNTNADVYALQNAKPPIRSYAMGRVYRKDYDMTHTPMFHQMDVLYVDQQVSFSELVWFVNYLLKAFFKKDIKIRLRASYFPFTIISAEVDILMGDKWLEVLGCGMLHPNVFQFAGWDKRKYSAFALGIGIDRLAMIKYQIPDLRPFFEGDLRFLKTYGLFPFNLC